MKTWQIIVLGILILSLIFGVVKCATTDRDYKVEYLQGKVIAVEYIKYMSSDNTKITLDNGGGLTLYGHFELIMGATYRFTFWKYDDWISKDAEFKSMELIQQ